MAVKTAKRVLMNSSLKNNDRDTITASPSPYKKEDWSLLTKFFLPESRRSSAEFNSLLVCD